MPLRRLLLREPEDEEVRRTAVGRGLDEAEVGALAGAPGGVVLAAAEHGHGAGLVWVVRRVLRGLFLFQPGLCRPHLSNWQ